MADGITALLAAHRFTWRDEYDLQAAIAAMLAEAGFAVEREVVVAPRCRIDILAGRVGVEIKVKGTAEAVARQLQRYAHSPALGALVLATTRATHRVMPDQIGGMPLSVAYLTHVA